MTPSFVLFHAENVNELQNSVCHLVLVPVIDGVRQTAVEFFFNPDAPFNFVQSGITAAQVESFPDYKSQWSRVQSIFDKYDIAVSSAEGYAARSLYGTLSRLGINFNPIHYCNAKAICRRSLNEIAYNFDYLSFVVFGDYITINDVPGIASRWSDLVLKGLADVEAATIPNFLSDAKITPGLIAPEEFIPSLCKRDYSTRERKVFDTSTVDVDAQPDHPFFGLNVVFTGKMESMTRNEARAAVVRVGGSAPDNLTMDTDYLVVGIQDLRVVGEKGLSGKMKSAAKYKEKGCPIEVIDEADFLELLGRNNIPQ